MSAKKIVSISVQSFSCNELKNYIWNVICKRYCYPYLEESSTTTTKDFSVYRRDYLVNKFRKSAASTSCAVNHYLRQIFLLLLVYCYKDRKSF
ncbi:Isocitrate dehydrogenase [NADP] cytoplasmic [Dirofilaria immitis]